jgi:hypothetical protein
VPCNCCTHLCPVPYVRDPLVHKICCRIVACPKVRGCARMFDQFTTFAPHKYNHLLLQNMDIHKPALTNMMVHTEGTSKPHKCGMSRRIETTCDLKTGNLQIVCMPCTLMLPLHTQPQRLLPVHKRRTVRTHTFGQLGQETHGFNNSDLGT